MGATFSKGVSGLVPPQPTVSYYYPNPPQSIKEWVLRYAHLDPNNPNGVVFRDAKGSELRKLLEDRLDRIIQDATT